MIWGKTIFFVLISVVIAMGIVNAQATSLEVTNLGTDAASYSPGNTVTVTATVLNNDHNEKRYISVDFVINNPGSETVFKETRTIYSLSGGSLKDVKSTYMLPSRASVGTWTVKVTVKKGDKIYDTEQTTFIVEMPLPTAG